MCDNLTYRSAGAETLVRMDTINILLRWSKEGVLGYVGTVFVQLNSSPDSVSQPNRIHPANVVYPFMFLFVQTC